MERWRPWGSAQHLSAQDRTEPWWARRSAAHDKGSHSGFGRRATAPEANREEPLLDLSSAVDQRQCGDVARSLWRGYDAFPLQCATS